MDLSLDARAADLVGYTHEEMEKYFHEHIQTFADKRGISYAEMFDLLGKDFELDAMERTAKNGCRKLAQRHGATENFEQSSGCVNRKACAMVSRMFQQLH